MKTLTGPAACSAIVGAHCVQHVRLLLPVNSHAEEEP